MSGLSLVANYSDRTSINHPVLVENPWLNHPTPLQADL